MLTEFVFGGSGARAYRPDDARNPLSAYGRTKAAGELLVGHRPAFSLLDSSATFAALDLPAVHWRTNLSEHLGQMRMAGGAR